MPFKASTPKAKHSQILTSLFSASYCAIKRSDLICYGIVRELLLTDEVIPMPSPYQSLMGL